MRTFENRAKSSHDFMRIKAQLLLGRTNQGNRYYINVNSFTSKLKIVSRFTRRFQHILYIACVLFLTTKEKIHWTFVSMKCFFISTRWNDIGTERIVIKTKNSTTCLHSCENKSIIHNRKCFQTAFRLHFTHTKAKKFFF